MQFYVIGILVILAGMVIIAMGIHAIRTRRGLVGQLIWGHEGGGGKAVLAGWAQVFGGLILVLIVTSALLLNLATGMLNRPDEAMAGGPRNRSEPAENRRMTVADHRRSDHGLDDHRVRNSELFGVSAGRDHYFDLAPSGGVLVGFHLTTGKAWGGAISSAAPIYQIGSEYRIGERIGEQNGKPYLLLAKPGFAVLHIKTRAGLALNALQLHYARIDSQSLNSADTYESAWIGSEGGSRDRSTPHGGFVVGIFGEGDEDTIGLGFATLNADQIDGYFSRQLSPPQTTAKTRLEKKLEAESDQLALVSSIRKKRRSPFEAADDGLANRDRPRNNFREPDEANDWDRFEEGAKRIQDKFSDAVADGQLDDEERQDIVNDAMNEFGGNRAFDRADRAGRNRPAKNPDDDADNDQPPRVMEKENRLMDPNEITPGIARDIDKAPEPIPTYRYNIDRAKMSDLVGWEQKTQYIDRAPVGTILVGFRVGIGGRWGGSIQNIRPIYQKQDEYYYGERHGPTGGDEEIVLAQPGFAVGGINVRSGTSINSIQVVFLKIKDDGLLNTTRDGYVSDWIGDGGVFDKKLFADGKHVVGIFGYYQDEIRSIGLAATRAVKGDKQKMDVGLRKWTSADGSFSLKARFVKVVGDEVELMREDGRVISVLIDSLSTADQEHIQQNRN